MTALFDSVMPFSLLLVAASAAIGYVVALVVTWRGARLRTQDILTKPHLYTRPLSDLCVDELKIVAAADCIDIYQDFDISEIDSQTTSVRKAWEVGQALENGKWNR